MSDQTITLLILAGSVGLFVWNRLPVGIVALSVAVALWATDVVTLDQAMAGFGSPTVVLIAALFVVAEALDAAGVTTWAGQVLIDRAGESRTRLMIFTMCLVAFLTALITPNGSVAALYPMAVVLAVRLNIPTSQLLMPVAFAAHAGSLLVLTGSPINLLISDAADEAGEGSIGFFEFALVGIPLLVGTVLVVMLFGSRLLPHRGAKSLPRDLSALPQTLLGQYIHGDNLFRLEIKPDSDCVGLNAAEIYQRSPDDVHLLGVQTSSGKPRQPEDPAQVGDVLVARGSSEGVARFATEHGLGGYPGYEGKPGFSGLVNRSFGVAEAIITPRSAYLGQRVFPGMVTDSGSLVVLAIQRHSEDLGTGEAVLRAGDSLLLQGRWDALDEHTVDPNVLLVESPDSIRRQAVPLGPRAKPALIVLLAMVVLLATGLVPSVIACLGAATAMVLLRVVTVDQAHRSMAWTTLILVGAMIPLSTAITETGVAEVLAEQIVDAVGGGSVYLLLSGIFLITAVLGQMISNTATALIMIPIALSVSVEMALSPMPLLMCVCVASAAALMTPVATPANMMVMDAGGYKFSDYWKLGLPVLLVYYVIGVFLVPVWWPV